MICTSRLGLRPVAGRHVTRIVELAKVTALYPGNLCAGSVYTCQ